jgi:hypothetical protein
MTISCEGHHILFGRLDGTLGQGETPKVKPKARQRHYFAERKIKKKAPLSGRDGALASTNYFRKTVSLGQKLVKDSNLA